MPANKSIQDIKHYWSYTFHDNEYGHITHMCYSYDEKFLFSVGSDSNIFGILFNSSIDELNKARKEKINITNKVFFLIYFLKSLILIKQIINKIDTS